MKLARVIGTVVTPVQHPAYDGKRLLAVRPINPDGSDAADRMFVAVDRAHAGVGDRVLLMAEGSSTRDILGEPEAPIRCSIVGVVDDVEIDGELQPHDTEPQA
jgi:ethanolamine utilization protein EutN